MLENIQWLGQASFRIQGSPLIYINPTRIVRSTFHADVILLSHRNPDLFSQADVEKLRGPATRLIVSEQLADEFPGCDVIRPWQSILIDRAVIKALPAYSPNSPLFPLSDGGLGFVISLNYYDIYYAGSTQIIPEMERVHPDIALLPIDGNGTLTVEDAHKVVTIIRPYSVIPYNWDAATENLAQRFKQLVGGQAQVDLQLFADNKRR